MRTRGCARVGEATGAALGDANLDEARFRHNIVIEGTPIKSPIIKKGVSKAKGTLKPGSFVYYCSVPGHRQAGMVGKLKVR